MFKHPFLQDIKLEELEAGEVNPPFIPDTGQANVDTGSNDLEEGLGGGVTDESGESDPSLQISKKDQEKFPKNLFQWNTTVGQKLGTRHTKVGFDG